MTTIEMIEDKCEMLIGCKVAEIDALEAKMSGIRNYHLNWYRKRIKSLEKQIEEIEEIYGIAQSQDR